MDTPSAINNIATSFAYLAERMLALEANLRKYKRRVTAHRATIGAMEREELEMWENWVAREDHLLQRIAELERENDVLLRDNAGLGEENRQFAAENRRLWEEIGKMRVVEVVDEVRDEGIGVKREMEEEEASEEGRESKRLRIEGKSNIESGYGSEEESDDDSNVDCSEGSEDDIVVISKEEFNTAAWGN